MTEAQKQQLINYIYDFAKTYALYYQVGNNADEILELVQQKVERPEDFINSCVKSIKIIE